MGVFRKKKGYMVPRGSTYNSPLILSIALINKDFISAKQFGRPISMIEPMIELENGCEYKRLKNKVSLRC